jgi:hypothetical protein
MRMMVIGFKNPKSDEVKDFWGKVVNEKGRDGDGVDVEMISGVWLDYGIFLLG